MRSLLCHPPSRRRRRALRRVLIAAGIAVVASGNARANPNGGAVHYGSATITGQGTAQVDVTQRTQGAVLSWEHFNIAPGEVTNFHQPNANATAINRILQQDPSRILGSLNANGNVYLINPNGFLFGSNARIDTHSFAAMTGVDAEGLKKLSGGYDASATSAPGAKIENHGAIQSGDGGFVYLIAPRVENGKDAVITTPKGEVLLAAGATVTLTDDPTGIGLGIHYTAPGQPGGEAVNLGKLVANGGFASMRAEVVRQGGVVQANAVRERAGKIELYASQTLTLESGSVTDASGGAGAGPGGAIRAKSAGDAQMDAGALLDVSGGAQGGNGGQAELSATGNLALGGALRAGAKAGSKRGSIVIDPTVLTIPSGVSLKGAGSIVAEASQRIDVAPGAVVNLADDAEAGDGSADRQSLTLRSGGDINFGAGAKIEDDGSGTGGQKIWDVNLVAGADLASAALLALAPGSQGSIYLSGASYDATGALRSLGTGDGEVSLTHGDLTVRATGDLVVGNGGGLKDVTGRIDVQVGRDVHFRAGSQTEDGVIENGSGDISIVAGGSVLLGEGPNVQGNAAIRTRGVQGADAQGQTTISDGGSITIQAGGDVDAGIGNRWLEPGPNFTPAQYQDLIDQNQGNPDLPLPPGFVAPSFDPMPVVRDGILGIGTEAGGDVTIVAGGSVRTGVSNQAHGGATAQALGTQYNGSHIGVFGVPVTRVVDPIFGGDRNVPIEGAPASRLTVVAGDAIEGDFAMRGGEAQFRAGYALAGGAAAQTLDPAHLDAALVESGAAEGDAAHGWFGTLARPVTVDLIGASLDAAGRNGVTIRAIENPSLVYPPNQSGGNFAVPTYGPDDRAALRSSHGDVILIGNDPNQLTRVLPPNVQIETDRGDLVLLNDFSIYPSERGGLDLQIAGSVRTANFSASSAAVMTIDVQTLGETGDAGFTLPVGTKLRDPATGIEYTLTVPVNVAPRLAAVAAQGQVVFHLSPEAASAGFVVPAGTRVSAYDGRVYQVLTKAVLLPPEQRPSQGQVTLFLSGKGAASAFQIPNGTEFVGPGGVRFAIDGNPPTIQPGQTQVTVSVTAKTPGVDVPAYGLALTSPVAGVDHATNLNPTRRSSDLTATVVAVEPGAAGNAFARSVTALLDPIPGVEGISNASNLKGGTDTALTGRGSATANSGPVVRADVLGPAGEPPNGTALVLEDPSLLPPGVDAGEIAITVGVPFVRATVSPAIYKSLTIGSDGVLRPDPAPGTVAKVTATEAWIRSGDGTSARITQSDAAPGIDARDLSAGFDYADYLANCRSGVDCKGVVYGSEPTHAADPSRAQLRALGGFDRVVIDLAKPAFVLTGDPGADGLFGTADDGSDGSLVDFALLTEHSKPGDETEVWVPIGDASFGATSPVPGVDPNPFSGLRVSGPGSAKLLVGVLPNPEGGTSRSAWRGSAESFTRIDEAKRTYGLDGGPIFTPRQTFVGSGDGVVTPEETPYVPSRRGGSIRLAEGPSDKTVATLGINTIGNVRDPALPIGSADLFVAADGQIDLGSRGSIETYQGGRLVVESVEGGVSAGSPPEGFTGRRGVVTLFRAPGFGDTPAAPSGGGAIGIDAEGDVSVGGLALAALSGSDITVYSRGGSIDAGVSSPFSSPSVFVDPSGTVNASFQGGGIFASSGNVGLFAKQDVKIGAGITGAGITISATNVTSSGTGGISGTQVNISATGTIGGSISASGSINVSGGATVQGASLSAGGLVAGAGAGVGSNTGGGKVSSELNNLTDRAAEVGAAGFQTAHALATDAQRGVVIQVSSRVIGGPDDDDSKKRP